MDCIRKKGKGKGKTKFTYVKCNGRNYRVADICDKVNVIDIYQDGDDHD